MSLEKEITLYFQSNNQRIAAKKVLVAKFLEGYRKKISAETLWIDIRKEQIDISIASVYQALNWMVDLGFAQKIIVGRKSLYRATKFSRDRKAENNDAA